MLQLTASLISTCYSFQSSARHAAQDQIRLTDELITLQTILASLVKRVQTDESSHSSQLSTLREACGQNGALKDCEGELERLKIKLEQSTTRLGRFGRAVRWPLEEGDVNKILNRMERFKQSFNLALSSDQT